VDTTLTAMIQNERFAGSKRPYSTPTIQSRGRIEEMTRWVGGRWGEFFSGQGSGWNPWQAPGTGS
jgi:hypothetical protein